MADYSQQGQTGDGYYQQDYQNTTAGEGGEGYYNTAQGAGTYGQCDTEFADYSNQKYFNSRIYVPGVDYWNAVDNTPAFPPGNDYQGEGELRTMRSNYVYDEEKRIYYNQTDPNDFYPADYMKEIAKKSGPVEETIVDIIKRKSTLKKLDTALSLYKESKGEKTNLSKASEREVRLPKVRMIKLKPRYQIQYPHGLPRHEQSSNSCSC